MVPSACRFWLRICSSLKSKGTKIPSVWAGSSSVVCWLGKACSPMKLVVFSFLPTSTKDQLFFSLFFLFPPEGRRPLCMFQGCAKVFFRSYPAAPQNKKKGVVPVLRSAQNRHNTLFLAGEGV